MHFEERLASKADPLIVWRRVSDIAAIPRYWRGTRSLAITRREGEVVYARVKFAFGGSGDAKFMTDQSKRTLIISYLSGPFRGVQTVTLDGRELSATWDVKFVGLFRLLSRWNESHFRSGTKHALERLGALDVE